MAVSVAAVFSQPQHAPIRIGANVRALKVTPVMATPVQVRIIHTCFIPVGLTDQIMLTRDHRINP